jgi:hypothetical protein
MQTEPCTNDDVHDGHTRWAKVYDQNQGKEVPKQVWCPGVPEKDD